VGRTRLDQPSGRSPAVLRNSDDATNGRKTPVASSAAGAYIRADSMGNGVGGWLLVGCWLVVGG
jgi:hypothetical protein